MIDHHLIQAVILGAVQGLTEFIPISSSGHLIIVRDLLGIPDQGNFFDAILHLATLVAILIYFRFDWMYMISAWTNGNKVKRHTRLAKKLSIVILVATIPALTIGWFANRWIEDNFRSLLTVGFLMIIIGLIFIVSEKMLKPKDDIKHLTWARALGIGLAQALAILPGISRSGATIVTGMYMNLKREAAAKFSFLMAAPIIATAGGYSLYLAIQQGIIFNDWLFWLVAFLTSLGFGLLAIKFLLAFLKKYSLNVFAYYLILVGLIIWVIKIV